MKKKIIIVALIAMIAINATGCKEKIFKEKDVPETSKKYTVDTLANDTYYIKDGTNFYTLYKPDGNFNKYSTTADSTRILWTYGDEEDDLIPTLYKNEILVYKSDGKIPSDFIFERYKDLGYTIGIRSLQYNEQAKTYDFKTESDVKSKSSAGKVVKNVKDQYTSLGIAKMDDSENIDITAAGTIKDLQKDKAYNFGVYAGSVYSETKIKADTHIYQSSEVFEVKETKSTKKGYVEIPLPENLKTGYYLVNGIGVIRYISDLKVDAGDLAEYDYNVSNEFELTSRALDDTLSGKNTETKFEVDQDYESAKISFAVTTEMELEKAVLYDPDGNEYPFAKEDYSETTYTVTLQPIKKGTYRIICTGKNMGDINPKAEYGRSTAEVQKEAEQQQADQASQEVAQEATQQAEKAYVPDGQATTSDDESSDGVSVIE